MRDFIGDFQAWLVANLYKGVHEEFGIPNLWHQEGNASRVKRAVNLEEYLKREQADSGRSLRDIVNPDSRGAYGEVGGLGDPGGRVRCWSRR